ncbi:hypothetical protein GCM10007385_09160 [Tateyamaria omphalii]|uniref:hypothetical protein n=1 Tax=Tateyamaria omphalii TaxID=299262 RepID=UPI0016741E75|nr:hypothetical protein [Tateyamaria omphalii]GGX43415.1 hypothetical protein GCM10007385_09160 [Tateyamaria omphalii]
MISTTFIIQFVLAIAFMGVAAAIGFAMARQRYRSENATRIALLAGETAKWRRRANNAEDRAKAAENALTRKRRRLRR